MTKQIRHINKVELLTAAQLRWSIPLPDSIHIYIPDILVTTRLPIIGLAQLEVSDTVEKCVRSWTSKLQCTLDERLELSAEPQALRLTDVSGQQYILGLAERPFPVINQAETHSSDTGNATANQITVTWTASWPAMMMIKG